MRNYNILPGLAAAGAVLALCGAAQAASLEIRRAVVRVTVIPEARADVAASVTHANARFPLKVSRSGDGVVIEGDIAWTSANCHSFFGHPSVNIWGRGDVHWEDMPQVVVRVPRDAKISAGGAVYGSVAPGASLDLGYAGCGDWTVADQAGPVRIAASGSGDVHAGSAGSADLRVAGSSDITLRAVRAGLTAAVTGSGDVTAERVDGPLRTRVAGSGDVRIKEGQVSDMTVQVSGSGDVRFGGVAQTLVAEVSGSGDVSAGRVTGAVVKHVSGSGDVTIGR